MKRREFAMLLGGAVAGWPLAIRAQQAEKVARIGFLGSGFASAWTSRLAALRAGLNDLGYVEGKNIVIEYRWTDGTYDRLLEFATDLVRLKVDVLVTYGTPGSLAAKRATTTIPIVMVHSGDAVATGIVTSLARPGGNITGSTLLNPELMAKRLDLLKGFLPNLSQVAVFVNPGNSLSGHVFKAVQVAAKSLGVASHPFDIRGPAELEGVFPAMARQRVDAVIVSEDTVFVANAREIGQLAIRNRIASAGFSEFAAAGGLIGYGASYPEMYRRAAYFVDKILRGEKPAGIPVEQASKFELAINLGTARALGLTVPAAMLARADTVIE